MARNKLALKWILTVVKKKICLVILIIMLSIVTCGIIEHYNKTNKECEYESLVTVLVEVPEVYAEKHVDLSYDAYQGVQKTIVNHFISLFKMESVVDEVISNLQLDMDYKEFITKTDVAVIDNSNMLSVKASDKDLDVTKKIINELIAISSEKAYKIFKIKNIEIIDDIQSNVISVKSTIKRNMIISGILGLLVSLLVIFLIEYLDNTIKTSADIEYNLNLPIIGIIDNPIKEDRLIICEASDSFAAEMYRNVVINISSMQKEKGIKTMVLASPSANKYKSVVIANIAIAFSRTGQKVLLIDGDMRESNISDLFELKDEMGLSDIIDKNISLNDIIIQLKSEGNLDILPSGKTFSNPADLLALENVKVLLDTLRRRYDTILIDAPSLEMVADPILFSIITDGTILMCEERNTKLETAILGKKKLKMTDSNILGTILQVKDSKDYEYILGNS